MATMVHATPQISIPPESEIDLLDNKLAMAVAAAMAQRRAGLPADAELRSIEKLSRQRKALLLRNTRAFA